MTAAENVQILRFFTGFLKTSPNIFFLIKFLSSCWLGTEPPKPSGHSSHIRRRKIYFNPPKIKGQSASDTTRESGVGNKRFMMKHDLRISSKDTKVPEQIWSITSSLGRCVWKKSGDLQKEGKTLSRRKTGNGLAGIVSQSR